MIPSSDHLVGIEAAIVAGEPAVVMNFDDGSALVFAVDEAAQVVVRISAALKTLAAHGGSRLD